MTTDVDMQLDREYIAAQIAHFASITAAGSGVTRLGYSALEREAHAHFAAEMNSFGLNVYTDPVGNTIAERQGAEPGRAAVGTGSHLDSVPNGGSYDGIAGVVAGMAIAKALHESGAHTHRPWRFVAFATEEGARFGQACNGSRAIAGTATLEELERFTDDDGTTMADAMRTVGLQPERLDEATWDPSQWHAFIEMHIEQGGTLEELETQIGAVTVISGSTRLLVTVTGVASHSGATPMHLRKDALVTASECILAADELAQESGGTRVTVGRMHVRPGSITTIPGEVEFSVDIRAAEEAEQHRMSEALRTRFIEVSDRRGTRIDVEQIAHIAPQPLADHVRDTTIASAKELGLSVMEIPSGASHDSQQIALVTPTGMIFVPSRDGISHAPEEFSTTDQLHAGTRVLLGALSKLDSTS